jgi:hypothetical protein
MGMFTIRIELHNAQASHYVTLAKALAGVGITDVVVDGATNRAYLHTR